MIFHVLVLVFKLLTLGSLNQMTFSVKIISVSPGPAATDLRYDGITQENIDRVYTIMSVVLRPCDIFKVSVYKSGQPRAIRTGYTDQRGLDAISDCVDIRKRQRMSREMQGILSALHKRLLYLE